MHHTHAYIAMLMDESSVPASRRGYMLRALTLMGQECHSMYGALEENGTLSDHWEPRNVASRIVEQTIPADPALREHVAELLYLHGDELATCARADRVSGRIDPLAPVTATSRSPLPQIEGFLIVMPAVLHELHAKDRFVNLLQNILLREFSHLSIAIVALEQKKHQDQDIQFLIHYSETDRDEEMRITALVEHTCTALLSWWSGTDRPSNSPISSGL